MSTFVQEPEAPEDARPVAFAASRVAPVSECCALSFAALGKLCNAPKPGRKDGAAWIPAHIEPGPRNGARVQSVSFLALDIESNAEPVKDATGKPVLDAHGDPVKRVTGPEPPSVEDMQAELSLSGWRSYLHTSYSHKAEHPRYRLIFDLSRALHPDELKPLGRHVAGMLGLADCYDSSALEPARLFYLPRYPDDTRREAFRFACVEGAPLDVDALLQAAHTIEAATQEAAHHRRDPHSTSVINAFNAAHHVGAILAAHGYEARPGNRWLYTESTTGMAGVRLLPGDPPRVYSSHGGDPLNDGHAHDAFDLYRILEHGGEMQAAVREAARVFGMDAIVESIAEARPVDADPEPFDVATPPAPWPADCLPQGMNEAAQAIASHVQAPEPLAAFAVLGAVAHLAQRHVNARHPKTGAMPCSLFLLTSADSGDRKSTCYNAATKPITAKENKQRQTYKRECAEIDARAASAKKAERSAIRADAPQDPRTIFTDTTVQKVMQAFIDGSKPALSLSTDEGGSLFSGYSMKAETRAASMGNLTRMFDGRGAERDRIGTNGVDPSGFRYNVRLSIFLSAQPVVLVGALADSVMRGQGLLPRFLYCAPPTVAGTRFEDEQSIQRHLSDDPRIIAYWHALERMDSGAIVMDAYGDLNPPTVGMDAAAVTAWLGLYNDTEAAQGEDGDYCHLRAFAARAGELAARIAAVYADWRQYWSADNTATVTADDMRRAAKLVRYSLAEWMRHSEAATLTGTERDARDLLNWLQRKGWGEFTRTKLATSGPSWLRKDAHRRSAAMDELKRRRWLAENQSAITVRENRTTPAANANCANSAKPGASRSVSKPPDTPAVSKISGISVSTREDCFPAPPPSPTNGNAARVAKGRL